MKSYLARKYSYFESYLLIFEMFQTLGYFIIGRRKNIISFASVERLMLSVTEVNGCEVCSYKHTSEALKAGLSEKEINDILAGSYESIPEEESVAIFFAQHYAEVKGFIERSSWERVKDEYGKRKALAILGVIRTIMVGNAFGIPLSSLKNRIKRKEIKGPGFFYELCMLLIFLPCMIIAFVHFFVSAIFGTRIRFCD
ncbi:MAG: carboxymuconolactone decarboxylase family protein [Spirochaetes bacterium]|jgi:AhpD family alkylhydroperoxidase|nr:carboxymuconolactone decarboxylase family protein [Spirochaetota bacterium]